MAPGGHAIKRRRLLLFGFVALLVVFGAAVIVAWPKSTAITPENAIKIQKSMTLTEVEALLGGPARNESALPRPPIQIKLSWETSQKAEVKCWASHDYAILVGFDEFGRVLWHRLCNIYRSQKSLLEKVRLWLHL